MRSIAWAALLALATLPAQAGPLAQFMLTLAQQEWAYFNKPEVHVEQGGTGYILADDESSDQAHKDRVCEYWIATNTDPALCHAEARYREWPWSAAFISWLARHAGIDEAILPSHPAHRFYLQWIVAHAGDPGAKLIPHAIGAYVPKPGDLLCATREDTTIADFHKIPDNAKLHCDLVWRVLPAQRVLHLLGGNVRDAVTLTVTPCDARGNPLPMPQRPWFMLVENRL